MTLNEWLYTFTIITNKLNKKRALTSDEIDELVDRIQDVEVFIEDAKSALLRKQ